MSICCSIVSKGRAVILIEDMDIARLMVYVQQVEEEKMRDRKEFRNKKAKLVKITLGSNEIMQIGLLSVSF